MDCTKLIAFGAFHKDNLWDYVKGKKRSVWGEKAATDFDADISIQWLGIRTGGGFCG